MGKFMDYIARRIRDNPANDGIERPWPNIRSSNMIWRERSMIPLVGENLPQRNNIDVSSMET